MDLECSLAQFAMIRSPTINQDLKKKYANNNFSKLFHSAYACCKLMELKEQLDTNFTMKKIKNKCSQLLDLDTPCRMHL